jgi:hypothetical protein
MYVINVLITVEEIYAKQGREFVPFILTFEEQ